MLRGDLTITNAWTDPTTPDIGQSVSLWLTVRNQGPGDIDNFTIAVNDSPEMASPKQTMTRNLDTGSIQNYYFTWTMVEGQTVYFMVDHGQKVSETNESNNSYEYSFNS